MRATSAITERVMNIMHWPQDINTSLFSLRPEKKPTKERMAAVRTPAPDIIGTKCGSQRRSKWPKMTVHQVYDDLRPLQF